MVVTHWAHALVSEKSSVLKSIGTRSLIEGVTGHGADEAVGEIVGGKDGFREGKLHEARLPGGIRR